MLEIVLAGKALALCASKHAASKHAAEAPIMSKHAYEKLNNELNVALLLELPVLMWFLETFKFRAERARILEHNRRVDEHNWRVDQQWFVPESAESARIYYSERRYAGPSSFYSSAVQCVLELQLWLSTFCCPILAVPVYLRVI